MADTLSDALREHLYRTFGDTPAAERGHWVMNPEWLTECRRLWSPSAGTALLGLPIEISDDGGAPHIEP